MTQPLSISNLYGDAVLQTAYSEFTIDTLRHLPSVFTAIQALGKEGTPMPYTVGARNFTWLVNYGRGGSSGFLNSGSVSHIGNLKGDRAQVAASYSYMYPRATADSREFDQWKKAGNSNHFYDKVGERVQAAMQAHMDLVERMHLAPTGDGRLDTVTDTTAAINAAASGTVSVNRREFFIKEATLRVYRTNAYVSGVILQVNDEPPVDGAGTVSVTNIGGSSYTPTSGDILYVDYADAQCFFSSLDESINTGAYPNRGQNIVQINNATWASQITSANGKQVTFEAIRGFLNNFRKRLTKSLAEKQYSPVTQKLEIPSVFLCSWEHMEAIRKELYAKQRYNGILESEDPTWGTVVTVDGITFVPSSLIPRNTIYFLHVPGWIYSMETPRTISAGTEGPWQRNPTTNLYEVVFEWCGGYYVADRMLQGKITNVAGLDFATDAGLTFTN